MKNPITCFEPIAHPSAKVLILGSMPGIQSLQASQYYAHKQNAFWKIMAEITGLNPYSPYAERLPILMGAGIAVWDVLNSCERAGSLDSAIKLELSKPNDFRSFFTAHPQIELICFNGGLAERYFLSQVATGLGIAIPSIRLPSTSPAHAALSLQQKTLAWRMAIGLRLTPTRFLILN